MVTAAIRCPRVIRSTPLAVADSDGSIWIAAEYVGQSCTDAQFAADTTCGGTRTFYANWGTFITHVQP